MIGIGGLGHLAIQFLKHWGCEVTAFTSSPEKAEAARELGAHHVVDSKDKNGLKSEVGRYAFILNTVNVSLDWEAYIAMLEPRGIFHTVGAVSSPMQISAFSLISGGKSICGSPLGSPALIRAMLRFAERHSIRPGVERFPMRDVNDALEHLRTGKARVRIVLDR